MNTNRTLRSGAFAAAAIAALLTAAPAQAATVTLLGCHSVLAKSYPKLVVTALTAISTCHKGRDAGKVLDTVDCNALLTDAANVDPKGKFAVAAVKYTAAIKKGCAGLESVLVQSPGGEATPEFQTCSVACPGVGSTINSLDELGLCHGCEAAAAADDAALSLLGMPANPATLSKDTKACRSALAKGYGKYLGTTVAEHNACLIAAEKAGTSTAGCDTADLKGKIQKALTSAEAGLDKACLAADFASMNSCAADITGLKTCSQSSSSDAAAQAYADNHTSPAPTGCPVAIRTTIRGGCSVTGSNPGTCTSGFETGTQLSVGWKGLGHAIDVTDNYTLAGDVTCPGTEKGTCGTCTINGISLDNPQYADFTRCATDPAVKCTHPFSTDTACGQLCLGGLPPHNICTSDTDCAGGNTCQAGSCNYYLGPPLAISAGGTPTCTLNVISTNITGTVDPDAGTSALLANLRAVVHSGLSQARPCPICRGDTAPQDQKKDGTCLGGAHPGGACDVQGFDLSFAPTNATAPTAGNSLDCPPSSGANLSGQGLAIALPLTTGTATKTAQDACDSPFGNLNCFCGACSLDPTISCEKDTDCSSIGKGNCGSAKASGGSDRLPNLCSDGICSTVPGQTDRGQCLGHSNPPKQCAAGTNDGTICTTDGDCTGGGHCATTGECTFGSNNGATCLTNGDCSGGGKCSGAAGADFDTYCEGLVTSKGHGVLSCNSDADCDSYKCTGPGCDNEDNWVCPGNDCLTCGLAYYRSCFLDPIEITGTPDTTNPILVGTFCLPPSTSGTVNLATGSPGPGVVQTDSIIDLRY